MRMSAAAAGSNDTTLNYIAQELVCSGKIFSKHDVAQQYHGTLSSTGGSSNNQETDSKVAERDCVIVNLPNTVQEE